MKYTVHIYAIEGDDSMRAIKAIRAALAAIYERSGEARSASLTAAKAVFDAFNENGVAYLGEVDKHYRVILDSLGDQGVLATVGDPAAAKRLYEYAKMSEAGATPEEVFAAQAPGEESQAASEPEFRPDADSAVAMALLVMCDGDPLRAAAHAATLSRAMGPGSVPMWRTIQESIFRTFPWIKERLTTGEGGGLL